jgi:antiviral helicase SKI2
VWEEVIIMLPDHIGIILLSATVPNTREFADWVGRTKKKDIYVISTPKRPVPLEHHLYAGKEIFKIVDSRGQFLNQGYKEAGEALKRKQEKEREAAGLGPLVRQGDRAARGRGAQQAGGRGGQARGGAPANRGRGAPLVANAAVRGTGTFTPLKGGMRAMGSNDRQLWVHLVCDQSRDPLSTTDNLMTDRRAEEARAVTGRCICVLEEEVRRILRFPH